MRPRSSKRRSESGGEGTRSTEMHSASCDGVTGGESSVVRMLCDMSWVFSAVILAVIMIRQRSVVRSSSLGA